MHKERVLCFSSVNQEKPFLLRMLKTQFRWYPSLKSLRIIPAPFFPSNSCLTYLVLISFTQCPYLTRFYLHLSSCSSWDFAKLKFQRAFVFSQHSSYSLFFCLHHPSDSTYAPQSWQELFLTNEKQIERNLDNRIAVWNHVAVYYLEITNRTQYIFKTMSASSNFLE